LSGNVPAGKVLIKVAYSPVNPHDHFAYGIHTEEGFGLGCEGSGIIVEVGEGVNAELVGKKVSFGAFGAWSTYIAVDLPSILLLDPSQDLSLAANGYGNPLTALNQLDVVKKSGSKSVIVNAAASALNKQFIRLTQ